MQILGKLQDRRPRRRTRLLNTNGHAGAEMHFPIAEKNNEESDWLKNLINHFLIAEKNNQSDWLKNLNNQINELCCNFEMNQIVI